MITCCSRFKLNDLVYTIKQIPFKVEVCCPLCEGIGALAFNNELILCPECRNEPIIKDTKHRVWIVEEEKLQITAVRVSKTKDSYTVGYKLNGVKRAEQNIFKTKVDAQAMCNVLNKSIKPAYNPLEKIPTTYLNSIQIETQFDVGDSVYTMPSEHSVEAQECNPVEVREIRVTLFSNRDTSIRYKLSNGKNRVQNRVFRYMGE